MRLWLPILSLLIGTALLGSSVLSFIQAGEASKVGPSLLQALAQGSGLFWLHIVWFLLAFTLIHAMAGWVFAYFSEPVTRTLETFVRSKSNQIMLLLFLIALLWLTLESASQFRNSISGRSLHDFTTHGIGALLRYLMAALVCSALIAGALIRSKRFLVGLKPLSAWLVLGTAGSLIILTGWNWASQSSQEPFPIQPDRPHVILVGIDGWRLDMLPQHGGPEGLMPFTEEFIANSAIAEEAVTPLARSFPSWWTIFTGQFPSRHGARFNLIAEELITTPALLPQQLGENGYYRIFAMDERRFANIRKDHGFDRIVGPRTGAADFLLGNLKDTPLTNLIVNTRAGKYLFPFNHANRAASHTYKPTTFDHMVTRALEKAPRQPLFLTVHYELPHWPYYWAEGPIGKYKPHELGRRFAHYMETLERTDSQLSALFQTLETQGILENAIVVLFSDHGEAFSNEQPVWYDSDTGRSLSTVSGHGTSILTPQQYRIPLMFRSFGSKEITPGVRRGRASLADIYPTLMDWLNLPIHPRTQGQSLLPAIEQPEKPIANLTIPLETGFTPSLLQDDQIDAATLFMDTHAYYQITTDARLELKPTFIPSLMGRKSRGIIYSNTFLQAGGIRTSSNQQPSWRIGQLNSKTLITTTASTPVDPQNSKLIERFCRLFDSDLQVVNHCMGNSPPDE